MSPWLLLAAASLAAADAPLPDPAAEARARSLMRELRCLVCQGQSIADSDADMARDMRRLVRARLAAGESPAETRAWLVERYGEGVTYRPPMGGATWPLWALPALVLLGGGWLAARRFRRRRR